MVRWGMRAAGMGMLMAALGTRSAAAQGTGTARKPAVKGVKLLHTDVQQSELKTLFVDIPFLVGVELEWEADEGAIVQASELLWSVKVDGEISGQGTVDLAADRLLPSELILSDINGVVRAAGDHVIEVNIDAGDTTTGDSKEIMAIKGGVSLIPLIVVIALAVLTQKVELSLFAGIFVAACIVNGNLKDGFKRTLDGYLLGAINDAGHIYVILFTFFLSGLVAIIEKSGGMLGLSTSLIRYAKTSQSAQMIAFCCGLLIFFDDYANCLVVGVTVVPITDLLYVSREKLAYIVDTTAAPIASIIPVSSWVGFEVGLIQDELDKIQAANNDVLPVGLGSGFSIFLTSIKYRFYPILLLVLQLILIASRRDFGPMLVAERRTQVYGRQDGGPGRFEAAGKLSNTNAPSKGTPLLWHNMLLPIVVLVIFIFVILVNTGAEYTSVANPSFLDKIESADSYEALLWGTFATVIIVMMFYAVQFKKDGKLVPPSFDFLKRSKDKKGASVARPLLGVYESIDSFLYGVDKVFPAIIVLTLAWAVAAAMVDVGADRLVASAIENDLEPTKLPTLVFILSALLALAIGTSWGTMAITFPLVTGPTWYASQSPELLTAVIASVLSGAVCGDHVSPISDTTVLSSVATGCNLMKHVYTQAPYVLVVALWSILVGTLPVGNDTYGPGVAILLGILLLLATVALLGMQVLDKKGRFDPLTELYMKLSPASSLHQLKADTAYAATSGMSATEAGSSNDESSDLQDDTGTSAADPVKAGAQQHSAEEQAGVPAGIQQSSEDGINRDTPHPGELAKV